jgi:predicted ester cyclase
MPEGAAAIIDRFYDAWNHHDAAAVAASFAAGGVYADPLTRVDLSGDNLTDHVQSVLEVIRDLRISLIRTIADEDAAAVVWATEGTWDGKLDALSASETPVRFEGTDVIELENGHLRLVRRSFDQLAAGPANDRRALRRG